MGRKSGGENYAHIRAVKLPRFTPMSTAILLKTANASIRPIRSDSNFRIGEHQRLRGHALIKLREKMFRANPLCVMCQRVGITRTWDELDHIVALQDGGTNEESNFQGLCFPHHAEKSKRENDAARGVTRE